MSRPRRAVGDVASRVNTAGTLARIPTPAFPGVARIYSADN
jgi:hypothetical protein